MKQHTNDGGDILGVGDQALRGQEPLEFAFDPCIGYQTRVHCSLVFQRPSLDYQQRGFSADGATRSVVALRRPRRHRERAFENGEVDARTRA